MNTNFVVNFHQSFIHSSRIWFQCAVLWRHCVESLPNALFYPACLLSVAFLPGHLQEGRVVLAHSLLALVRVFIMPSTAGGHRDNSLGCPFGVQSKLALLMLIVLLLQLMFLRCCHFLFPFHLPLLASSPTAMTPPF